MQCREGKPRTVAGSVGWWRMCVCGGDGGGRDGVGMQTLISDRCGRGPRQGSEWLGGEGGLGFRQHWKKVITTSEGDLALNRATSRRSGKRRDVPESKFSNVATFGTTSQRSRG